MSEKATNDLMLEILKTLQADSKATRGDIRDMRDSMISMREEMHGLRGDLLRQERAIASLENDIDRIKVRLDLVD